MNIEQLSTYLGIEYGECSKLVDALDGTGFTDDQIIAIITAIIRAKYY